MPRGRPAKLKVVAKKSSAPKLSLQSVADAHAKIAAVAQKTEQKAVVWLEKAKTALVKAEAVVEKHAKKAKATPASRAAAAKARVAKKEAAVKVKAARAELNVALNATKKAVAAERKVVSAQAKLLAAKVKHEAKMLAALAKLETQLAKAALKGSRRRGRPAGKVAKVSATAASSAV